MAIEDIRNFVSLSDALATAGQPSEEQLEDVARAGFDVVVNLAVLDPRCKFSDEAGVARSLGMTYHHIPVDFKAPRFEDLTTFIAIMDASRDKRVFVHCAANYRASTFVALYGQARLGWSDEGANAQIKRQWNPNDTWQEFIAASRRTIAS